MHRPGTDVSDPGMPAPTIVFDLDGTLIDTAPDLIDTLNVVFAREGLPALPYQAARNLIGGGGSPVHEVGDAIAAAEQLALLRGMQEPCGETRSMQRRPETVARTGEVMPGKRGVQTRIDADEEHPQSRCDDIANAFVLAGEELGLARPP